MNDEVAEAIRNLRRALITAVVCFALAVIALTLGIRFEADRSATANCEAINETYAVTGFFLDQLVAQVQDPLRPDQIEAIEAIRGRIELRDC